MNPGFKRVADHALLVEFATEVSERASQSVIALDQAIAAHPVEGVLEVVPAMVNLLVDFDPVITDHTVVEKAVRDRLAIDPGELGAPSQHTVHICYDAALAPDLAAVATASGMSSEAVIAAHLAGEYQVLMYGFAPGYAYMTGVPGAIQVPRKPAPVRGVHAGSVVVAGQQCLVTTLQMPTGWSIVGRSPTKVLLDDPVHPFLFAVGDRVLFERIDLDTYGRLTGAG